MSAARERERHERKRSTNKKVVRGRNNTGEETTRAREQHGRGNNTGDEITRGREQQGREDIRVGRCVMIVGEGWGYLSVSLVYWRHGRSGRV